MSPPGQINSKPIKIASGVYFIMRTMIVKHGKESFKLKVYGSQNHYCMYGGISSDCFIY